MRVSYEAFYMRLLDESKSLQPKFYEWLGEKYPDDVLIMNWGGRSEPKWNNKKGKHFSNFHCTFDIARAHRTSELNSPLLFGYEIKGTSEDKRSKEGYKIPEIHEGIGQALFLLKQDADFVYLVRPKPKNDDDAQALEDFIKKYAPHCGLYFVREVDGKLEFEPKVEPREPNLFINPQRKATNIAMACIFRRGLTKIRKQMWARTHDYKPPSS